MLRVVDVVEGTSVDGPGLRTSIYFAGCNHRCPGCHNEQTWSFSAGKDVSIEELEAIIDYNKFDVTLSGGDPLYHSTALLPLVKAIKQKGKGIWCYTGFTYEELSSGAVDGAWELLDYIDVLVDGPYVESLRDPSLLFRGSSNQRLIDVAASKKAGKIVLWESPYNN